MPGRRQALSHAHPRPRWNQLDLAIVLLSIMGITLEEIEVNAALPINPTIIRIMRVLRIARGRPPASPPGPRLSGGPAARLPVLDAPLTFPEAPAAGRC